MIKKSPPLLPRTYQGPIAKKSLGSEQEAISWYFRSGHLTHLPLLEVSWDEQSAQMTSQHKKLSKISLPTRYST